MNYFEKLKTELTILNYIKPITESKQAIVYEINDIYRYFTFDNRAKVLAIGTAWSVTQRDGQAIYTSGNITKMNEILEKRQRAFLDENYLLKIYLGSFGEKMLVEINFIPKIKDLL